MTQAQILDVTLAGQAFKVDVRRPAAAAFWRRTQAGDWEDDTFRFIEEHVDGATSFVDIGGWIGPIALAASARAKRVLSIEPDPVAIVDLKENAALNGDKVEVWNVALDNQPGELTLYAPAGAGDSITSSLATGGEPIVIRTIAFADIDVYLGQGAKVALKMDIEGHEYRIADAFLDFVKRHRCPVHLSLHPRAFCTGERRTKGFFAARKATYEATLSILNALAQMGTLTLSLTGGPADETDLRRRIFFKKRPKNYSVVFEPR